MELQRVVTTEEVLLTSRVSSHFRLPTRAQGRELAERWGVPFFETSAKLNFSASAPTADTLHLILSFSLTITSPAPVPVSVLEPVAMRVSVAVYLTRFSQTLLK
jgi:tRNA A37 threonylcarbamoyladenosine synthetase subunit TsaC/SUA5/YrdC